MHVLGALGAVLAVTTDSGGRLHVEDDHGGVEDGASMASGAALAGCEKGSKTARTDQRPEAGNITFQPTDPDFASTVSFVRHVAGRTSRDPFPVLKQLRCFELEVVASEDLHGDDGFHGRAHGAAAA
ncbi:hypothetical protein ZWY2020_024249 [Hordeum vulgare]|nr:hypothetical protein ZWY2020_024249 [Hordeum vulgare]